ncbi:MAG: ATP-binding protein, partial [Bryobacteraceae bacterium]
RRATVATAVAGALSLNFFFVPPYRSFAINDFWYVLTVAGLLTTGLIVSTLMVATREEALAARRREARISALYSFTNSLADASEVEQILEAVSHHFLAAFHRPIVIWLKTGGKLTEHFRSPAFIPDPREYSIVARVFENGQEAGSDTGAIAGSPIHCSPIMSGQTAVGVIGFRSDERRGPLQPEQRELLGIFMGQTALALTRAQLAKEAQRAEVLQEADKLQRALLNSVSHDLRTPLASVLGVLNTILEDGSLIDQGTQQSLLRTAQDEGKRLDWLVQNLLDMTRLAGGAIRVKAELNDVQDLIASALQQLGESALRRSIDVSISPDLPLVAMDDVLILQVLVNLLDNAIKYSPPDSPIAVDVRPEKDRLAIRIMDRGRGIPEEELDRVFDKFYRVTSPGGPKGAGLGLSICKGFIEAHHGSIFAKRRPDGGTEFLINLPMELPLPELSHA